VAARAGESPAAALVTTAASGGGQPRGLATGFAEGVALRRPAGARRLGWLQGTAGGRHRRDRIRDRRSPTRARHRGDARDAHQAFADTRVRTLIAHTLAHRNASNRVLQKAGFHHDAQTVQDGAVIWRFSVARPGRA